MFRAALSAALLVCACASPAAAQGDQPALGDGSARISGKVVDPGTRTGVAGVVVAVRVAGFQPRTARTDSQGQFLITRLPPGLFTITATKDGYLPSVAGATQPRGFGHPVSLTDDQWATIPAISLWRFGGISGRVTDDKRKGAAGVRVYALTKAMAGGVETLAIAGSATTSPDGGYGIGRLEPGTYVVAAVRDGVYFAGGSAAPEASPTFTIDSGTAVQNADVELPDVETVSVSGRVFGPDGPAAGVTVALEPARPIAATTLDPHVTSAAGQGSFTVRGVPPGDYVLRAWSVSATAGERDVEAAAEPDAVRPFLWTEMSVSVGDRSVNDLVITLHAAPSVSGTVNFTGNGQPFADAARSLQVLLVEPGASRPAVVAPVDAQNHFSMPSVPPGRYQFRVVTAGLLGNWYLRAAVANGRDLSDEPFDLRADLRSVTISLTDQPTAVTGRVSFTNAPDTAIASVLVFPLERSRWPGPTVALRRFARLRVSNGSSFALVGLPAGSYLIAAVNDDDVADWMSRDTLDLLSRVASRLDVTERGTSNLFLTAVSLPIR